MELYFKKYFWMVPMLVVVAGAVLAAKATNHVIEAKYLIGGEVARKPAAPARPPKKAEPQAPSKSAAPITGRNIFCSSCAPEKAEPVATAAEPTDANRPPATSLPLTLLATSVAKNSRFSSATIANTQSNRSGSYWMDEEIPGAGPIVRVEPRFVDFKNKNSDRVERIDLMGAAATAAAGKPAPKPAASPTPTAGGEADFLAEADKGVRKLSDTSYEIDRALVDRVLGDPNLVGRSARIVPSIKDGKANGFKLYAIRPNSVYAKIGLQNGDTIHSVNGFEMTSPDKALEVYTKVKSANSLSISVTRRGQPVTMDYTIK